MNCNYGVDVAQLDIAFNQNAPFSIRIDHFDDLGNGLFSIGDTIQFRIRSEKAPNSSLIADFSGYFTLANSTYGSINVPAAQLAALNFETGYYTIQLVRGGVVVKRLFEGIATLSRNT